VNLHLTPSRYGCTTRPPSVDARRSRLHDIPQMSWAPHGEEIGGPNVVFADGARVAVSYSVPARVRLVVPSRASSARATAVSGSSARPRSQAAA
jgi:hypothetical protein